MFPSSHQQHSDLMCQMSGPDESGGLSNSGQYQDCRRKGKSTTSLPQSMGEEAEDVRTSTNINNTQEPLPRAPLSKSSWEISSHGGKDKQHQRGNVVQARNLWKCRALDSFTADLSCKLQSSRQEVFVVQNFQPSWPYSYWPKSNLCRTKGLISRGRFHGCSRDWVPLKGEYEVRLKPNATPHVLLQPGICPFPSERKFVRVISQVNVPTD